MRQLFFIGTTCVIFPSLCYVHYLRIKRQEETIMDIVINMLRHRGIQHIAPIQWRQSNNYIQT